MLYSFRFVVITFSVKMRSSSRRRAQRPHRYDDGLEVTRRRVRRRNAAVRVAAECRNCRRRNLVLTSCERSEVHTRRGYCTFSITEIPSGGSCQLCDECRAYLTAAEFDSRDKGIWKVVWPSFLWTFLADASDDSVVEKCGVEEAWKFVPLNWRAWWLPALVEYRTVRWALPGMSLEGVGAHFTDVTDSLRRFEDMLDGLELGNIRKVCNELNFPTVYCPWGCATFLQDVGGLDLQAVFHHVLRKRRVKVAGTTVSKETLPFCLSMRPDFLDPRHPRHLLCPDMEVLPSIGNHRTKGMCVLTCACHSGGTLKRYYHVPRSPFGLMSHAGDQLAHCVVHHRTVKPMAPKRYSNTYQLFMQCGSFSGIGMSCLKTNGNFSIRSELLAHSESLSIACRDDIRGLLGILEDDGHIHPKTSAKMRETSAGMHPDGGLHARVMYAAGTTYTSYVDCMKLQRELATAHQVTVASRTVDGSVTRSTFEPVWMRSIVWIHPADGHGALFHPLRCLFGSKVITEKLSVLYILLGAMTTQPSLWDDLAAGIRNDYDWSGQMLVFASRVFPYRKYRPGAKTDPFKVARKKEPAAMVALLGLSGDSFSLVHCLRRAVSARDMVTWTQPQRFAPSDHGGLPFSIDSVMSTHHYFVCSRRRIWAVSGRIALPDYFSAGDSDRSRFELRYFSCSDGGGCTRLFARHGGPFLSWFMTSTDEEEFLYSDDTECQANSPRWDFAIYVNTKVPDVEELRREFLSYTGGQSAVTCRDHDLPLIVVGTRTFSGNERCPGLPDSDGCGRKLYYKCPRRGCTVCLCRDCLRSVTEHLPLRVSLGAVSVGTSGEVDASSVAEVVEEVDDASVGSDIGAADGDSEFGEDVVGGRDEFDNEGDDVAFGMPLLQGLHDGSDEPLFDPEAGACDAGLACPEVPRTIAHANTIPDLVPDADSNFVGNVCILNGLGSLLVRSRHDVNMARSNHEFLQERIVSRYGYSIPMLYAEATLFPSVFPFDDSQTPSILGAIPSAFLSQDKNSGEHGVASLVNHVRNRIQLADATSGVDYRYHTYMFDSLLNRNLSNEDSRVVLNRGVASCNTPAGLKVREKDDHFFSDSIDNRQNVMNLTESQKYYRSNWFITITANQKLTFGLSPVKNWIDGDGWVPEVEKIIGRELEYDEMREFRTAVHDSSCTLMTRCWLKVRYIIMAYIMDSLEKPFGDLLTLFWRDEYQDGEGNLSHIHGLARAVVGSEGELRVLRDKIRGFNADIVRIEEVDDFVERGIFDRHEDWYTMSEEARMLLTHRTDRNKKRVGTGDSDVVSRVLDPVHLTPDCTQHVAVRINPGHTPEVVAILARCGLCDVPPAYDPSRFEGEHELLQCTRHYPPVRAGEHSMSPVHGALFAAMRSMSNVQVVAGYTIARYVTKYLIKVDKNSHTVCRVSAHDESKVSAKHSFLFNTKIAQSNTNETKRIESNKRENRHPQGRVVARPEIVQILVGDAQVHHNMDFVKVATTPLEDRVGFKKIPDIERKEPDENSVLAHYRSLAGDNSLCFVVYPDYVRRFQGLPNWRQFTQNQMLIINDHFGSDVTVSKATVFDARPPELRELFPCLLSYYRWFDRAKLHSTKDGDEELLAAISPDLRESEWIDGFGFTVRLRLNAFDEVRDYVTGVGGALIRPPNAELLHLVSDILLAAANPDWHSLKMRFVVSDELPSTTWARSRPLLPVPVHSFVKPTNTTKFLFHVLLCFGQYETELDLVSHATMREAFKYANLVDDSTESALLSSVTALIRLYVVGQLAYYPVGTRTWNNYLVAATKALEDAIIRGTIPINELPACLYSSLLGEVDAKVKKRLDALREATIRAAYEELSSSLALVQDAPTLEQLISGERVFGGTLPRSGGQSAESFAEQERARELIQRTLVDYSDPTRTTMARSAMVAGGPGNGKTHCLMYSALLFYAHNWVIVPCAILADRARAIGGEHFHLLFSFPTCTATAQRLAELAVVHILRKPESVELLLRIDALALDESGTMSAAIFSALDIIMRRVRGSNTWMGGMVIITTIDDKQLKPVRGYPLLLSPHILTCFRVVILKHSVRSSDDRNQQRVIEISRMPERELNDNEDIVNEVLHLVSSGCTFVRGWNDPAINDRTLRVFPKKLPVFEAVDQFYAKIEADFAAGTSGHAVLRSRNAEDVQNAVESHGQYRAACDAVKALLDKDAKEPRRLLFFPFAVFLFTFNDPKRTFTQSRLAIMYDVPPQSDLDAFRPIHLYAAPPGVRSAPEHTLTRGELLERGWTRVRLVTAPERKQTYSCYGVRAKRKQYGIRPFISATIHCIQGATLYALATSIEIHKRELRLWERAQWLVLISRTRRLEDVIFVGDKQKTLDMIRRVLLIRSQFAEYTDRVLQVAAGESYDSVRMTHDLHPYRPRDKKLPYNSIGFCYLIVSSQTWTLTYIGQTEDLNRRIRDHNSGQGARETRGKGPWLLVAYVVGFGRNETARRHFEDDWQNAARYGFAEMRARGSVPSTATILDAAEDLLQTARDGGTIRAYANMDLTLVQHADLSPNVPRS